MLPPNMHFNCFVCNKEIVPERVEILLDMGINRNHMTCVHHSTTKPIKGIYMGENGTSELKLCNRVDNDSVRSKLYDAEVAATEEVDTDEIDEP